MQPRIIPALALALWCAATGVWAEPPASRGDDAKSRQISGVLKEIFHDQTKIKLKTDLDKILVVDVPRPDLLAGLTAEDRIVVELDDRGEAAKITKASIPELPEPPQGTEAAPAQGR